MSRTILITGSASGIGHATARRCKDAGDRVIGVDVRNADIEVDLGTVQGRARLGQEAMRLAPDGFDAVVACAGIAAAERPRDVIAINYFGAVATLEQLRPLMVEKRRPRAVTICSTASVLPVNEAALAACLAGDEAAALEAIAETPQQAYATSKRALSLWLRRVAVTSAWAGAGILLNAVAPGVVDTPMSKVANADPAMLHILAQTNPIATNGFGEPEEIAELIQFLAGFEGNYMLGQIIYNDGGTDAILRPEKF